MSLVNWHVACKSKVEVSQGARVGQKSYPNGGQVLAMAGIRKAEALVSSESIETNRKKGKLGVGGRRGGCDG